MTSSDDAFIIGIYSRVCQLLKAVKERLASAACAAHRRQDNLKIAGQAVAARLGEPSRKLRSQKRGRKLPPAILPVAEKSLPDYDECLFEPCMLHRFLGEQGEIKVMHLTKDYRVVQKLREGAGQNLSFLRSTMTLTGVAAEEVPAAAYVFHPSEST